METHQNEIQMINEKDIEREKRIRKKAEELVDAEIAKEEAAKKNTDKYGKELPEKPQETDKYGKELTDEEIDQADIGEGKSNQPVLEEMTKAQLLKTAKKLGIKIGKETKFLGITIGKKTTNADIIKAIKKAEKAAAKAAEENNEPDLTDESEVE
jgi:hypothetical protein